MMSETDSESVNVEQFANETVRLTTAITRVLNAPDIVTGEVSGSGKTIAVEHPNREGKTFRLDTATIMSGESEFRDSRSFTLYTPEDFQNTQSANYGPGPQAGSNGVSDTEDLPEPTHTPVGQDSEDGDSSDANPGDDGGKTVMTDGGEDLMDQLTALDAGDDVKITVVRDDGEELELDGYITDTFHEPCEPASTGVPLSGSLNVDVELANSAVERLQDYEGGWLRTATHQVDISAKERHPQKWDDPSIMMWDPETDDGMVTQDHWTALGELRSVQRVETDGGEDIPEDGEGRTAILSAPVLATDVRGTARWSIGTRDAVFYDDSERSTSLEGQAAVVGPFAQAIMDAVKATGKEPGQTLFMGMSGPVAWAHLFADPRDTEADPSEYVSVVWTVEPDDEGANPGGEPMTDGGREPPSDEDLMDLSSDERVTLELDSGERVTGVVQDPHHPNLNYPERIGNGQVKVGIELDAGDADDLFYGSVVQVTAYHGDKNPERREDVTVVESYRVMYGDMVDESDRAEVVTLTREESGSSDANPGGKPMTDGGTPRFDCPACRHTADSIDDMMVTADGRLSCPECGHTPATERGEPMTDGGEDTEDVVDAFADAMADLMTGFSDVEPDEEYSTQIKLFIRNREGDDVKVAVSGFTIIGPEEHEKMEREVLDRVDLRKAPKPDGSRASAKTVVIGTITFLGTGEILEIDISPEYLKPSERGDSDE